MTVSAPASVESIRTLALVGATCSGKTTLAEALLHELGIRQRFAAMIGADTLPVRKPDPRPYRAAVEGAGGEMARSFLVGDTETDRKTASAAAVCSVASAVTSFSTF